LRNVTLPNSVTSIGNSAFFYCSGVTSVTMGNGVTNIGDYAFASCISLTNAIIGDSVTRIGAYSFEGCTRLASVTIPASLTYVGDDAFGDCYGLIATYFLGIAPPDPFDVFDDGFGGYDPVIVYYLPGTTGWGPDFSNVPTELWNPQAS